MGGQENEARKRASRFVERTSSRVRTKLYNALSTPEALPTYLAEHLRAVRRAATNGGVLEAAFYLPRLFGIETYRPYLRRHNEDGFVRRPVQGFEMWLPIEDTGLARELIWRGVHEPRATELYLRLLERLAARVDEVTVLEVGTNIGYFPLLALDALSKDAVVHAVEPNPATRRLLERNLELNGYRDRVDVDRFALSNRNGTGRLYLSEATNWSQLGSPPARYGGESIEVEVRTGDSLVRGRGVPPGRVNVVRMDVQGHELDVLEGIPEVLGGEQPLLLFVELHDEIRDAGRLDAFVTLLKRNGLTLERGIAEPYFRTGPSVEQLDELYEFPFDRWTSVGLFLRKGW